MQIVVSCTKGISVDSLETVNQILTRVLPEALHSRLAYLSGPSFAAEVSVSLNGPEQYAKSWAQSRASVTAAPGAHQRIWLDCPFVLLRNDIFWDLLAVGFREVVAVAEHE